MSSQTAKIPAASRRLRRFHAAWWVGLAFGVVAAALQSAMAAPEYALSGWSAELEQVALAKTPAGPITALDLLMFDEMTEQALWSVPIEALLDPKSLAAERYRDPIREAVERLAAAQTLADRAGRWLPAEDQVRVMTFGAGEAAWIDQTVMNRIRVEDADIHRYYLEHANDYLRRRQVRVRYIFKRHAPDDADGAARLRAALDTLAFQVRQGTLSFEEAARRQSDAQSAADGGLLPPFYDRTYFSAFEQAAFDLDQPGQMSQPFPGPGGLYLVQLVQSFPTRNIPIDEVSAEIANRLKHEHVRHFYRYAYDQVRERVAGRSFAYWWPGQNAEAPVALVGAVRLARQDFIRFYGNPTDLNYQVRWDVVGGGIDAWIEGETIRQELARIGGAEHRWIKRARLLAAVVLRARHTLAVEASPEAFLNADAAARTLQSGDAMGKYFRAYHLVQFQIAPVLDTELTATEQRQAVHLAQYLEDQLRMGTLRTEPAPTELAAWRADALAGGAANLPAAIRQLNDAIEASQWPNVKVTILDQAWISPLPDEPLYRLLQGTQAGEIGRTQIIGPMRALPFVLETAPARLDLWQGQTVALRELAFQSELRRIEDRERQRLLSQGAIEFLM